MADFVVDEEINADEPGRKGRSAVEGFAVWILVKWWQRLH